MIHSPAHPGRVLHEEFVALGISISQAAKDLGVSRQILSGILNARRPITPEMAVRIGHYIGNGASIWARMQVAHDLFEAEQAMKSKLKRIPRAATT
jgi:addiction module HigA family antidote